jgi:hypothetical protein
MKKEYMKPSLSVEELLLCEGILQGSNLEITPDKPVTPFTNKHQGGWSQEQWKTEE